ncbi:MAG: hypothetical protein ACTSYO_02450 [Candidatus Ranarchaeia archaeon]
MRKYVLLNQKINKKVWLATAQDFRKGRTLPIDTKSFPVDSTRLVELHGLLSFMNALTRKGYKLGLDFELVEPESVDQREEE